MEILVAILIIALIAAVAYAVLQQRKHPRGRDLGHPGAAPTGHRDRGVPAHDPMAAAVAEHAQATDPQDVIAAEARMREQARRVAAPMQAEANRAEHQRAADQMGHGGSYAADQRGDGAGADGYDYPASAPVHGDQRGDNGIDPATGARTDGYRDPASDPRYDDRRR